MSSSATVAHCVRIVEELMESALSGVTMYSKADAPSTGQQLQYASQSPFNRIGQNTRSLIWEASRYSTRMILAH